MAMRIWKPRPPRVGPSLRAFLPAILAIWISALPDPACADTEQTGSSAAPSVPTTVPVDQRPQKTAVDTNAQDLGRNVAGVVSSRAVEQGAYAPDFVFRGFPNGGVSLINGQQFGFSSKLLDFAGIERTEFAKGVSSLLFDAPPGASGPAANYLTKRPDSFVFAHGNVSLGSFDFRRATLDVNAPLNVNKNVLLRLNVAVQDQRSFVNFVRADRAYVNPSLTILFENGDQLNLTADYLLGHSLDNYGLPTYLPSPIFLRLPRNFYAALPSNETQTTDQENVTLRYDRQLAPNWHLAATVDYLRASKPYGWFTNWRYDGGRSIAFGNAARTDFRSESFDAQINLKGRFQLASVEHNVFFGLDHWQYSDQYQNRVARAPPAALDIFTPNYSQTIDYAAAFRGSQSDRSFINSAVAQDLIDLTARWHVLLGGRYDYLASIEGVDDPTGAVTGSPLQLTSRGTNPNFSPRVGILYQPFRDTAVFAAYGKSFIPNYGVRLASGQLAAPEKDTQYEAGLRQAVFDRKLKGELGVFDIRRNNVPAADPFNPTGFYSVLTGQQHSQGLELSLQAEPVPHLIIGATGTFLHALVAQDSNIPSQLGSDLLGAPRRVLNLSVDYSFVTGPLRGCDAGLSYYYTSRTQATLPNTPGFVLPPVRILTASVTYKLTENVSASLRATNLTDSANFTSDGVILRGEPRTLNGSLAFRF